MSERKYKRQEKVTSVHGAHIIRVFTRLLAVAVILVQFALPIAPVFASEVATSTDAQVTALSTSESSTPTTDSALPQDIVFDPVSPTEQSSVENISDTSNATAAPSSELSLPDAPPPATTLSDASSTLSSVEPVLLQSALADSTLTDLTTENTTVEVLADIDASTTDTTLLVSESATTTDSQELGDVHALPIAVVDTTVTTDPIVPSDAAPEITVEQPETHVVVNDNNRFSFSEQECASVGDGSFYCSDAKAEPVVSGTNRVFAASDAEGDQEIYTERGGILTQITFNQTDDSAPYYDDRSDTIVWHRLINDRYQIVSYDLKTEKEEVLTNDRYNNMQPSRSAGITVWQAWIGNDWEVMLDYQGELIMLTDNTTHDIGPRVNGEYIIWQSFEDSAWKAKIYNIATKETKTIANTDGSSVENPRFVLVYDSKSEAGDVETHGYDPVTGINVPLSSKSAPAPEDIPSPDQTGQNRALISPTAQLKTKTEDDGDPDVPAADGPQLNGNVATSSSDVVIPSFENASDTPLMLENDSATPLIKDVIIPAPEVELPPIPDLIIAPFETATGTLVLPQESVAEIE